MLRVYFASSSEYSPRQKVTNLGMGTSICASSMNPAMPQVLHAAVDSAFLLSQSVGFTSVGAVHEVVGASVTALLVAGRMA